MKMQTYHQKTRILQNGNKIYIGEDAYPYADEGVIIVCDGFGNGEDFSPAKIDSKICDKENFYSVIFKGVFENDCDQAFVEYVLQSFDEIFQNKNSILESGHSSRALAYFASRIASVVGLYLVKFSSELNKEGLFEKMDRAKGEQEVKEIIADYAKIFSAKLKEKMQAVAKNMGLCDGDVTKDEGFLSTTMQLSLVYEASREVRVVCLTAGNSRAYCLNDSGLVQLALDNDQLINLSSDFCVKPTLIDKIKKPCILLNATDGCYASPLFLSPLDFEYLLLDTIKGNADLQNVSNALISVFKSIGTHDDANSLALSSYGYSDFLQLKTSVAVRLKNIDERFISRLPKLFEVDYEYEVESAVNGVIGALYNDSSALLADEELTCELIDEMIEKAYEGYLLEAEKLFKSKTVTSNEYFKLVKDGVRENALYYTTIKREEIEKQYNDARNKLLVLISENWDNGLCLSDLNPTGELVKDGQKVSSFNLSRDMKAEIFLKIRKKEIIFKDEKLICGDIERQIDSEIYQKFNNALISLFSAGTHEYLRKAMQKLNRSMVSEYYLKFPEYYAKKLYEKHGDKVCEMATSGEVKNASEKLNLARKSLEIRSEIYAEYQTQYLQLLTK